jgi:predicted regulator of Ras-like GTPase activity (Roadblock/LC7/MglB family)
LRQWIAPTPLLGQSQHDMTQVSLALNVVAPMFFSHVSRRAAAKKKTEIVSDIPDVFGSASANAVRELKPVEPAVAPRATTPVADAPVTANQLRMIGHPATAAPEMNRAAIPPVEVTEEPPLAQLVKQTATHTNGNGNGNGHHAETPTNGFPKIDWTPEQAVRLTCVTPGVGGAMVATDDGLMVATQLPAQFKSETLSAFVPQIFRHATQSLAELHTAPLSCVRLTLGDTQCEIFKTGKLYYVIMSRPGEELPEAFLRKVAGELTKRN